VLLIVSNRERRAEAGESAGDASSLVPGSTLAETLEAVPLPDGGVDAYIAKERFRAQFCADVSVDQAALISAASVETSRSRSAACMTRPWPKESRGVAREPTP
jgi:hypothetical protein